jgi:hypothetical protein
MATAAGLMTRQGVLLVGARGWRGGSSRFADRVGEGDQVIGSGRRRCEIAVVPHEFPASGGGEAAGVRLAQVVRMGLGKRRQGSDDGRGIAVDVGQSGNRLSGTAVPGAAPW